MLIKLTANQQAVLAPGSKIKDATGLLDGRTADASFIRNAADVIPEKKPELESIAGMYDDVVRAARTMIDILGGFRDPSALSAFAHYDIRSRLAKTVRAAREIEQQIADAQGAVNGGVMCRRAPH